MTPEERSLLENLFERVRSEQKTPRDPQAEKLIADALVAQPYATYVLAQAVIVQEQALQEAHRRLQDMETRQAAQGGNQAGGFLGNARKSWFGGMLPAGAPPLQGNPPPPPQQPSVPPTGPGAPSQAGSFLQQALGAATGAAGGVLLAESVRGMFGGHWGRSSGDGQAMAATNELQAQDVKQDNEQDASNLQDQADDQGGDSSWFA